MTADELDDLLQRARVVAARSRLRAGVVRVREDGTTELVTYGGPTLDGSLGK